MESALDQPAVHAERAQALAGATGDIVEIGIGTGLNVPHYPKSVQRLTAVGREPAADERAVKRAAERGIELRYQSGDALRLPLGDASADVAVVTFLLCSVADPGTALAEARRILRPGGRMLFLEHVV